MKGSDTHLSSSIANGGKGLRTLKEAPEETNCFDKTNKVTDKTDEDTDTKKKKYLGNRV